MCSCQRPIRNLDLVHVRRVGHQFDVDVVSCGKTARRNLHVDLVQPGEARRKTRVFDGADIVYRWTALFPVEAGFACGLQTHMVCFYIYSKVRPRQPIPPKEK